MPSFTSKVNGWIHQHGNRPTLVNLHGSTTEQRGCRNRPDQPNRVRPFSMNSDKCGFLACGQIHKNLILDEEMMSAKVLQMFLQNWCCKLQVIGQNRQNTLIYDLCLLSWLHNQTTTYTSCRHYHQLYCLHILHIFVIISAMKSRQSHKLSKLAYHFGVLCSWFFR